MSGNPQPLQDWSRSRSPQLTRSRFANGHQLSNGTEEAESSASGSQRSGGSSRGRDVLDSITFSRQREEHGATENHSRSSNNNSGKRSRGFLLEFSSPTSGLRRPAGSSDADNDGKEKRQTSWGSLSVSKRRPESYKRHEASHGSSPLANHVSNSTGDTGTSKSTDRTYVDNRRSIVRSNDHNENRPSQNDVRSNGQHPPPPVFGYDTDPAQIVNMALSLSEGRRRNFSGARLVSEATPNNRVVSAGHSSPRLHSMRANGGIGQYMASRKASLQSSQQSRAQQFSTERKGTAVVDPNIGNFESQPIVDNSPDQNNVLYDVSAATFTRVEQAKRYFELLYEYRRLLSHLPPLRRSGKSRGAESHDSQDQNEGRLYNPLQYARNRKVRFREKSLIQSEQDGWYDVEKVRSWVDAVVENDTEPRTDPDECVRLPPLQDKPIVAMDDEPDPSSCSPTPSIKQRHENTTTKPRRPRQDWVTFPGDYIADAHWLEQGLNKTKIEDNAGSKIYPSNVSIKFSGWRHHTPAHDEIPPIPQPGEALSQSAQNEVPGLPSFRRSPKEGANPGRRKRRSLRDSIISSHHLEMRKKLNRERHEPRHSSVSKSQSDSDEETFRGRSKLSRRKSPHRHRPADRVFDDTQKDKSEDEAFRRGSPHSYISSNGKDIPISSIDERRGSKASNRGLLGLLYSKDDDGRRSLSLHRRSGSKSSNKSPSKKEQTPRNSIEETTTAPNSPAVDQFPSIAINLSPPGSRSPSPQKRPLQERINPFRSERDTSKRRHGVEASDFAKILPSENSSRHPSGEERPPTSEYQGSRGTSPFDKRASLVPEEPIHPIELRRTQSTIWKSSNKPTLFQDSSSRIRGMFKGGRIAELVGSEVSRMGDFIWKRDIPQTPHDISPPASVSTLSDTEDETPLKTPPSARLRREQTNNSSRSAKRRSSHSQSRIELPQYHVNNLPTFTSPFQRDKEQQARSGSNTLVEDPISRQVRETRSRSRSSRFERLAPPRLDLSPTPSNLELRRSGSKREDSYGFEKTLNLAGSQTASTRMNDAFAHHPKLVGPPVTGLASFNASHSQSPIRGRSRPKLLTARSANSARDFSLSSQTFRRADSPPTHETTLSDISRIRALLLSSGVKARKICRRGYAVRDPPPKFLLEAFADRNEPVPPIIRREEHLWASKRLIASLETRSNALRSDLHDFSVRCAPSLHSRLQGINDLVDNQLNPRVRQAADDAGALSQKMSTSSTLAIKQLNDAVDAAIRRRRRGRRWMRKVAYVMIEWAVVGMMWWVWLLVMIFKVVRGTVGGFILGIRWLLWL